MKMGTDDFLSMVYNYIKSPEKTVELINNAFSELCLSHESLWYRPPGYYEILDYDEVYVIGDLHGDYETLIEIMSKEQFIEKLSEYSGVKIVFLGDYIDRGAYQLEIIASVLLLKYLFPENIVLLRGNHEPPPFLIPYPHDFPEHLIQRFGVEGKELYYEFLRIFQKIPVVARIPERILFLHGGVPLEVVKAKCFEEVFSIGYPTIDDWILEEIIWSDPLNNPSVLYEYSFRGAGILYGPQLTEKMLQLANTKYIVRGHEAIDGYKLDHGGKVVTLFTSKIPYGLIQGSYMYFRKEDDLSDIEQFIKLI